MPLYECSQCHCVDNTALTNFWMTNAVGDPPLCSECDPKIGEWHGRFPKRPVSEYKPVEITYPVRQKQDTPK